MFMAASMSSWLKYALCEVTGVWTDDNMGEAPSDSGIGRNDGVFGNWNVVVFMGETSGSGC